MQKRNRDIDAFMRRARIAGLMLQVLYYLKFPILAWASFYAGGSFIVLMIRSQMQQDSLLNLFYGQFDPPLHLWALVFAVVVLIVNLALEKALE